MLAPLPMYSAAFGHIWGQAGPEQPVPSAGAPCHGTLPSAPSTGMLHNISPSISCGLKQSRRFFFFGFFFFFWRNDQTGGGDRTSCVKPHPEQASPRFTVNKYSLLAALPSTVTALAPITFQVQTGKQRKASEMADMRFNLLFTAVFIGGALPIRRHCQLPGITPGPSFFLLTFIIVLLWASPQTALQKKSCKKCSSYPLLDKQPDSNPAAADRKATEIY